MDAGSAKILSESERLAWLRLIRSENVGPLNFRTLLEHYGDASTALEALPELARRGGRRRPIKVCSRADAEAEVARIEDRGARLIAACEPDFPAELTSVPDAPPVLTVLGHPHLLRQNKVAIVGARNASANGLRLAEQLAREISAAGFAVVSGLARGIDAAAHRGALTSGTLGVVAGGIDVIYPMENARLHEQIAEQGVILSEQPFGTRPQARHFPRRNRIISGLALATLVVEAAPRSGSLITARLASEQGREVLAVPGSPLDPRCQGCNELIRQGATLVQRAEDVLEAVSPMIRTLLSERKRPEFGSPAATRPDEKATAKARSQIWELIGASPVSVDELVRRCQLSQPVVTMALLELELAGYLERHPGNCVARIYDPDQEQDQTLLL